MATDSAQAWLERCKGNVSEQEWKLLERAQKTLIGNILLSADPSKPLQWEPHRGICPSPFHYHGVWNWDAAFHAIAAARWDTELARDQIRIFLDNQLPSGALPDVLWEAGGAVTDFGKPPVMPWACAIIDHYDPDDAFLREAYGKFVAYEAHWRRDRGGDEHGLFHYGSPGESGVDAARLESGWDNSPRWDKASNTLWTVDGNSFMVMLYRAMAYMADRLRLAEDRLQWQARERALSARINEKLWNPAAGAYMDYDFVTGEFSSVLTPASFHPLYARIASEEQAGQLARLAADPARFYPGFPSVSYGDPAYTRGDFWRGPTWLNIAYFAIKGLYYYGHDRVAESCRRAILDWCSRDADYLYEYYDSRSGQGLGAKQFGWTAAFVIEFILHWDKENDL